MGVKWRDFQMPKRLDCDETTYTDTYGKFVAEIPLWLMMLVNWAIIINIGVGLFNLLPLGPVDGGKMFYTLMLGVFKRMKIGKNCPIVENFSAKQLDFAFKASLIASIAIVLASQ